jgi:hypothetical protein
MLVLAGVCAGPLTAQDKTITLSVSAERDYENVPVCAPLSLPKSAATMRYAWLEGGGLSVEGQLTDPSLTTQASAPSTRDLVRRDLHFIVPSLKKGQTLTLTAKLHAENSSPDPSSFVWRSEKDQPTELIYYVLGGSRQIPVLRYMNASFDDSSKDARERSYKVFHHLYDPDGKRLVTNGGHTDLAPGETRKLLFPHHRGIMFGFNKCTYGEGLKKKADTWHCTGDAHVAHEKVLAQEAGGVLGRHRALIGWHGEKKERFAQEEREVGVLRVPGGTLVEFAARLTTTGGKVRLDGDPQHAGFQFRASNDVADKTAKQTYYLRPDGKDAPGKTRNWPADKSMVDLPWYAMSFVLDGQRYTACYLNHPTNPKESRFSERDYGRFGGYFEYNLTPESTLLVNYRLWLQQGEMTGEQAQALYDAFATPPKTSAK